MKPPLFFAVAVVFCARSASCQETKCLEPTSLQVHDRVQGAGDFETEFPVGSTLRYRCGPGYIKEGTDTWNATCIQKEDGSVDWDIDQYDCSPVSCGHPGDVHNGRLLNFDFHFPKNVRYDCNEGYELEGQPILYCQSDAKWNAPTPTCRIVECSPLESIANGTVRSVGTVFDSKAEFSCYHGFKLVGNSTRTCGADGRWTGQYPYCEVVECGHMEGIANGILVISGTVFGSKANFSCRRGFELVGDNTRTCNAEGRWTGESPHCEVVECGVLEDIANGTVRLSGTVYGSKADFSCNRGFKLVGENTRTCDADGRWTGESPRCEATCVVSPDPGSQVLRSTSRGSLTRLSLEPGTEVSESDNSLVVKCIEGYHFRGASLRRTGRSQMPLSCKGGLWDPPQPWCTEISLGCSLEQFFEVAPPGLAINASTSHVRHNTTFRAFCDGPGLTLVGNGKPITCLEDDSWAIPPHMKCIEPCGSFDTGPDGPAVDESKHSYGLGDSVTLSCRNGTVLQPRIERLFCLGEQGWSEKALPICVPVPEEDIRRSGSRVFRKTSRQPR